MVCANIQIYNSQMVYINSQMLTGKLQLTTLNALHCQRFAFYLVQISPLGMGGYIEGNTFIEPELLKGVMLCEVPFSLVENVISLEWCVFKCQCCKIPFH